MVLLTLFSDNTNTENFKIYYNVPITLNNDKYELL